MIYKGKSSFGKISRGYYKKKRFKLFWIVLIIIIAGYITFNFTGKNIKYIWYVKKGVKFLEKNKVNYAISEFNKALNLNPSGALAIDGLGSCYLRKNNIEKSKKYFLDALSAGLKYNKILNHSKLGNYYLDRGFYKRAEIEYRHALKLNNVDSYALFGLGCCYHAYGEIDKAINYYQKSLTYNPKFTKARKNLSLAEEDKNKGAIYYIFDRNGEPLARYNLIKIKNKRTYILDQKAAHITGFISKKRNKSYGIEKYFKDYLPGNKIYLTIDIKVQQVISRALGWYKGSIVVVNPKTGEILGLYNQPTFRPNSITRDWWRVVSNKNKPLINRAIDKLYEPGSIAKLITIAAFLESGINEKDIFPVRCAGSTRFNNIPFWCWKKHGKIRNIEQAIETSCNIGAAFLGFAVGGARLFEYNAKFGFGYEFDLGINDNLRNEKISIPVKISKAPSIHRNKYEVAMHACGLSPYDNNSYLITPLLAALLAATIANNGIMMKPYIIKGIRNINGKLIYKSEPEILKKPISPQTAKKLTYYMVKAVEDGIGKKARVKGIKVAGKTGTSGGSKKGLLNAWFISFAPADSPKYAIAIVGEDAGKGMYVAAPIAHDIYKTLLK